MFGSRPDTNSAEFNFQQEIERLPFRFNIEKEAKLTCEEQSQFIGRIYNNQEVYSLHGEDLGYCDHIGHMIPTMMGKPIYLPHHTIL